MPAAFGSYSDLPPAPVTETFALPEGFERNHLFLSQTKHFLEVVRGDAQPVCSLQDGVLALKMALAAHESQKTGRVLAVT
jgi:predicted dehydrogenase